MNSSNSKKANRLINERSPYLLQHAYNPVDWYPWGEEAFVKAKKENKPVFLSVGYSTCHWCHVMEKDSFEDVEVAGLINKYFVPVKVDREERPDIDQKYMAACQALTGQGGWPLTVFLTPEKKPFYAGTFFPKTSRYGINGLMEILPRLKEFWEEDRDRVVKAADELVDALRKMSADDGGQVKKVSSLEELPAADLLDRAYQSFKKSYDSDYGGFGSAPKFPAPHQLLFLLRYWKRSGKQEARDMVLETLRKIHRGGIFDQLGFGLHRYSVDEKWLVPHFEKMLYDQSLIALAALEAFRASGEPEMALFARKIFSYLNRDMQSEEGAYYAAEDADSEGEEGTFYVWRPEEIVRILGSEKAILVNEYFGVTGNGNFEGNRSIMHRQYDDHEFAKAKGMTVEELDAILEGAREKLLSARGKRERPFLDDKIITSWNGMLIAALARGSVVLEDKEYLETAKKAASFILDRMALPDGRLVRRYREGEAAIDAFLDDYANLAWGMLEIYKAGGEKEYLDQAETLGRKMLELFDRSDGFLNYAAHSEGESDFAEKAEAYDGATPSGVSVAAMNLLQLGRMFQDSKLEEKGISLIIAQLDRVDRYPTGFAYLLSALDFSVSEAGKKFTCDVDGSCGWE